MNIDELTNTTPEGAAHTNGGKSSDTKVNHDEWNGNGATQQFEGEDTETDTEQPIVQDNVSSVHSDEDEEREREGETNNNNNDEEMEEPVYTDTLEKGEAEELIDTDISEDEDRDTEKTESINKKRPLAINEKVRNWVSYTEQFESFRNLTNHVSSTYVQDPRIDGDTIENGGLVPSKLALVTHIRSEPEEENFLCLMPEFLDGSKISEMVSTQLKTIDGNTKGVDSEYGTLIDIVKEKISLDLYEKLEKVPEFERYLHDNDLELRKAKSSSIDELLEPPSKKQKSLSNIELRDRLDNSDKTYKHALAELSKETFESKPSRALKEKDIDDQLSLSELQQLHESLHRKQLWANEVQGVLARDLKELKAEKRELWMKKEILLEALIASEIEKDKAMYDP